MTETVALCVFTREKVDDKGRSSQNRLRFRIVLAVWVRCSFHGLFGDVKKGFVVVPSDGCGRGGISISLRSGSRIDGNAVIRRYVYFRLFGFYLKKKSKN